MLGIMLSMIWLSLKVCRKDPKTCPDDRDLLMPHHPCQISSSLQFLHVPGDPYALSQEREMLHL